MKIAKAYIFPLVWCLLPWVLMLIYHIHKPDHADIVWLPLMPMVFASFLPDLVLGHSGDGWFPLPTVIICSLFNLTIGTLIVYSIRRSFFEITETEDRK